ncbi:WD domain containing protein [Akanthomyces lecanii RCEF 1005]|uniref:WD domain containing protein n=1 Tax=Akanthomyces lecanii RCEF 1005 TaxID=1081108 RepID=A0A168KEM4_CORDF|nr:WD domain containing protein [Akanthomyces lecanii RCEF 1005]
MAGSNAMELKRELAQVPITAVAFYRDAASNALHVLASEDTDLVVYRVSGNDNVSAKHDVQKPLARVRILSAQPIHGIYVHQPEGSDPSAGRVLLWGGSSVAMLKVSDLDLQGQGSASPSKRVARLRAPDWIYDGAISVADENLAVLVTAHNEVITVRFDEHAATAVLSSTLVSPSRPMLYAANVCWTSPTDVLVAAGTVFGDILVWMHTFDADSSPRTQQTTRPRILYSLSGHEGSIFGVHMSPLMEMPDGSAVRLLASCSDDRTIRLWNITESEAGEGDVAVLDAVGKVEASDTGFRCAPAVYGEDGAGAKGRADLSPVATVMGHASRIWGVRFGLPSTTSLTDSQRQLWGGAENKGLLSVYSFGEDATVQKWTVDIVAAVQMPQSAALVHSKTYTLHDGKHLWSRNIFCSVEDGVATTHVLAGGADSKITLVKVTADVAGNTKTYNGAETWEIDDIVLATEPPQARAKQRKEVIGRYDFVTPDILLAVSNMGKVLLATFDGKDATWEELSVEDEATREDMKNVYALKTVSYGGALLGSITGGVYYFGLRDRRMVKAATLAGRVVEMNTLSKTFQGAAGDAEAIIHLHRDAASVHLTIDRETGAVKSQEEIVDLDSRFVAISAARIDDLLALGSRHGWIALLRRDADTGAFRPILNLPPASGDAVTAIVPLPPSPTAPASCRTKYILATSRDGKYRIFQLHVDNGEDGAAHMTLLHETAPPFGLWIEGAWFTDDQAPELILYGFRSKDFVVWNETRREELATMDCGGAHRTFRLAYDAQDASRVRFAFTRTSRLVVHSQRGVFYELVRLGQHGREIRSLAAAGRYVATGAEDTSIRLWEPDVGGGVAMMQHRAYLKRHVVGLQKLQWMGDEHLFSSGGNEELFAWRVRTLDSAYAGRVAVVCEGVFADKSPVGDLRIMDFDVSPDGGGDERQGSTLVTMAFSNSALKTYRYTAAGGFALVCEGLYTSACLTQARHLETSDATGGLHVVTASTDGHIALWRGSSSSGNYELMQTLRVHQSSVKSLAMTRLAGGRRGFGIVTGGDDNALAWTLLKREEEENPTAAAGLACYQAELGTVVRRAHAAAITGIALLEEEQNSRNTGETRCVSVSNDQWVKTWRMREGVDGMELLGETYSGVADAGDVVVLEGSGDSRRRSVMVAGVGLEIWRLE